MSFFTNLRADRLITEIRSCTDPSSPDTQKAIARLKDLGPGAIESVFAALPDADKNATLAFVEVLAGLVSPKSFPLFVRGLVEGSPRVVAGIAWALTTSRNYPPNLLIEALTTAGVSKSALLEVIAAQKSRFGVRELLNAAYTQEPNEKAALFRIIGDIADANTVPELIGRVHGKDPIARVHIINILARFNSPEVQTALQGLLKDPNKLIRGATLSALQRMDGKIDIERVCALLKDPEIDVQNKAIDVVIKANDPDTIRYLIEVLKDENENARRAAVEVLNEVGNAKSVKHLLEALKDSDWWVRSRAADALGKIGGPRVIEAVLRAHPRQGRGYPPRRHRDPQPDEGRAGGRFAHPGYPRSGLVGERAGGRCAGGDRQQARRAASDGDAESGLRRRRRRSSSAPSASSATRSSSIRCCPSWRGRSGSCGSRPCRRSRSWSTTGAPSSCARSCRPRRSRRIRPSPGSRHAALAELDHRLAGGAAITGGTQLPAPAAVTRPPQPAQPIEADARGSHRCGRAIADRGGAAAARHPDSQARRYHRGPLQVHRSHRPRRLRHRAADGGHRRRRAADPQVPEPQRVANDEEVMKRFVHELRYSRKITHKNVIRIYDFLFIQGNYAISMEYFPSHTLGSEIVGDKPIELKRALQFGIDMCTGMTVAHQVGIVHRDLKPANVLINQEGLLKIVDFGVAAAHREGDTQLTKTGYVIGSPKYMAPEQILGKKVDERADIYALGVILYEMLTGVPPYSRGDHMSVMYQHVQGKARPPHEINPALPAGLSELVVKAMAVDKTKRFQSMDELRAALGKYL